jgi:cation diffusion facilitator family transporter
MACCEHDHDDSQVPVIDPLYRRILMIALVINALMFAVEIVAGSAAGSKALLADALDFLADATNYAISLYVLGMALVWRARAALIKGVSMGVLGIWVLGVTVYDVWRGVPPEAFTMGVVGAMALFSNVLVAWLLYRFRQGDSNMQSVWICSRNDAIGNIAVMGAALGVMVTGKAWPDLLVAFGMAALSLSGAVHIMRQALQELREEAGS